MDQITSSLVEREYQKNALRCPYLTQLEIETCVLAQLEAEGKVMRCLTRDGKGIAWKATPEMRRRTAVHEAAQRIAAAETNKRLSLKALGR